MEIPRIDGAAVALAGLALVRTLGLPQAPPQRFTPDRTQPSDLTVRLEPVGTMPSHENPTSPVVAGSALLLVEQAGAIFRWTGTSAESLLSRDNLPKGVKPYGVESISNVAATRDGSVVYVMFISSDAPKEIPRAKSPRPFSDHWYVLCAYDFDGTRLTRPRPITALQARWDGHTGGGLAVLGDGTVLFSAGDNGDSYEDGGTDAQDPANHLAKIVRIDPTTGLVRVLAVGVRAAQRLLVSTFDDGERASFVDPGGWVSEELNSVRLADLTGDPPLDFGWGRAPSDGRSREGTFYIDKLGNSTGRIAAAESGIVDPVAEFGREDAEKVAVSGPVTSRQSFTRITFLFGDLVSGRVYAVTGPPSTTRQAVFGVNLVDASNQPTELRSLAGGERPDPRFFNFPDGAAGVLLERTGTFYRLTEVK